MTHKEILQIFEKTGALLTGHFVLTSGLHSKQYFQCAQVLKHPDLAAKLCAQLAEHFRQHSVQVVAAPAVGGIIVAHETAKALQTPAMFAEREHGAMTFRRGFTITPGERVLVVEDVVTTGGSVQEVIAAVRQLGGEVVGAGCLVDRSAGRVDLGVPLHALISLEIQTYQPDDPELAELGPAVKPGSRTLSAHG